MAEDKIFEVGAGTDIASTKTLRELLIEQSNKPNARATFRTTLSRLGEKIRLTKDGPLMSLLDLTADEIKISPNIIKRILIDPNSTIQKLEAIRIAEGKVRNPYLLSIIKDIDQALGKKGAGLPDSFIKNKLRNDLGEKAFDKLTHYSLSGKQSKYIMPEDFYIKSEKAIAAMTNVDDKAIASLIYLGGFRGRDLAKVRIENIDFLTGEMLGSTKVGQVEGIFNPAMMDIIKEHIKRTGGRTSGLLFEGLTQNHKTQGIIFKNSVENRINKHLRNSFGGKIDMRTPGSKNVPSVIVKENMSLKVFRHANEDLYNRAGIVGPDREVATMRPVTEETRGQNYGDPTVDKTPAKNLQTEMTALKSSYSGRTPGSFLKIIGYKVGDISKATKDIIPSKDYILGGREKFSNFVQKSFPNFFAELPTGKIIVPEKGIDVSGLQSAVDMGDPDAKQKALLTEGENIELERQNIKAKVTLEKEKLTLEEQIIDLKEDKALQRKINALSDKEKARFERFKVKFPDATQKDLYEAVKGKGPGYTKFLKNYAGKIIASKGLKGTVIGLAGGELTRRSIERAEPAEFGPDEDSIIAKLGNALGLSIEDMADIGKGVRHTTNVASSLPVVGTAALPVDLLATGLIPTQEDKDLFASLKAGAVNWWEEASEKAEVQRTRSLNEMKRNLAYDQEKKKIGRAFEEEERQKLLEKEKKWLAEEAKKEEEWRASDKGFLDFNNN